jgi:serine/threonine-protein kinase
VIAAGTRIGSYELLRPLGAGGFGRTFEARHALLGEKACLKLAHPGADAETEALLLREAKVLWGLHHPSLPTLRDVLRSPEDGGLVLAMRFVEGSPLAALAPIDLPTALRVFGRLLRALRVLHHRGIVHGDVKPANIIVEPDLHGVVLVDLGLAAVRPGARSRAVGFTSAFAAPEILAGKPPLPESDLYSLGMTLVAAQGGDVERRVLPAGVPEDLLKLVAKLTRKDPAARPRWDTRDPMVSFDRIAKRYLSDSSERA